MATPSPSSVATVGPVVGMVTTAAIRPTIARPDPTLKIADTSGTAAVMSDANINSSRTSAAARPISSDA